jgi:hypothetical protein
MNLGADEKKRIAAGVLGFIAIAAVGYQMMSFFGGPTTPPPQVAAATPAAVTKPEVIPQGGKVGAGAAGTPAGAAAVKVGTVSGQLDPTLHMEGMLTAEAMEYNGTGRNIFAPGAMQAPVKIAEAIAPARPKGPIVPPPVIAQGTPPPPPINLKFFGVATQKGVRRALLLGGDDVFLASPGDIVQRRYKVVSIAANSITVEDMPNSNKQTLPLVAN